MSGRRATAARATRRFPRVLGPVLAACCVLPLARGQDQGPPTGPVEPHTAAEAAVAAIAADLSVERTLLDEALERHRQIGGRRAALLERLRELYGDLDRRVGAAGTTGAPAGIEGLLLQIDAAEAERGRLVASERGLVEQIVVQSRRVTLLEQQRSELAGRLVTQEAGTLSGAWDVTLLPLEQKGSFELRQSGTLISGTYRLDGGWSGSLQGTLVNRKVYLVRIDSRLGKSMELEGYVAADGRTIRGTWLNYELAGADGSTGQWSASRR